MISGYGLLGSGEMYRDEAMKEITEAAGLEAQRENTNKMIKAQTQTANMTAGASVGALAGGAIAGAEWGSAAGPYGTIIGALAGGLLGRYA